MNLGPMRFPPQFLDELRARLPVSEVVGRRVKLKRAGREWKGLVAVQPGEDALLHGQRPEGLLQGLLVRHVTATSSPSSWRPRGSRSPRRSSGSPASPALPMPKVSPEAEAQEERRRTLHDVVELAAKFFEATLASRAGAVARGYLADRGLDPATQLEFRLGYAPSERFALKEDLGKQGVSVPDMIEAGLLVSGDDIPVPFDRFRDRVMFPITDLRGRVVAFGGRALDKDAPAKYLNSPETPLFHKGAMLYNGAAARAAAHQGAAVIAVEGYVDVIAMVTAGLRGDRRAARHRAHRGSARAPLENGRRADAVLRRRRRRPARRLSGGRSRAAAPPARQEREIRDPARGAGPRRPGPLRRARGGRRGAGERAAARRHAVDAGNRGRQLRHAGAAGGARGADRPRRRLDRRRGRAQILSAGPRRPAARAVSQRPRARRVSGRSSAAREGNPAAIGRSAAASASRPRRLRRSARACRRAPSCAGQQAPCRRARL